MAGVKTKRAGAAKAPVWTVTDCTECGKLIDSAGSELTFQGDSIEGAIELATDRMAILSGLCDL